MNAIEALLDHRTRLLAMKTGLIAQLVGRTSYNGWLDGDIKECNRLIELAITHGAKDAA